jgi:predicted GNAT superfamily acetyltransferase
MRGQGVARCLYNAIFDAARQAGHQRVLCEVNIRPANAPSDAFHAALGFAELGRATLKGGKTVRYLAREIGSSSSAPRAGAPLRT